MGEINKVHPFIEGISAVASPTSHGKEKVVSPTSRDTISSTPITKPQLSHPSHPVLRLVQNFEENEKVCAGLVNLQGDAFVYQKNQLQEIQNKNIEAIQAAAKHAQKNESWAYFQKIASFMVAAVSTVFGSALMSVDSKSVTGTTMVIAGLMTASNIAFSEAGAWDWIAKKLSEGNKELENKLITFLPLAVGSLSTTIGLAGSSATLAWTSLSLMQKGGTIFQTGLNIVEGASDAVSAAHKFQLLRLQEALLAIKKDFFNHQNVLEDISNAMEHFMKVINRSVEETAKAIALFNQSTQTAINIQG